jgi:hypothetical protein
MFTPTSLPQLGMRKKRLSKNDWDAIFSLFLYTIYPPLSQLGASCFLDSPVMKAFDAVWGDLGRRMLLIHCAEH